MNEKLKKIINFYVFSLKKFWDFVWKGESIFSWLVFLILTYLFIKFLLFPSFGLILSTSLPLVLIESDSMHHVADFQRWYEIMGYWYKERNISFEEINSWKFKNGMDKGDIIILEGWSDINIGDVVVFNANQRYPIIHRVVWKNETSIATKGDNNFEQIYFERNILKENVLGKAWIRIPKLGWIKLFFVELLRKTS